MKLLYAIVDHDCFVVKTCGNESCFLVSDVEVDTGYGFESPESDNQWIYDHCGIQVYRKCIYFAYNHCVAVFEPIGSTLLQNGYVWANQISTETDAGQALVLARNNPQSKTVPWMARHGISKYLTWAQKTLTDMGHTICGTIRQIKNAYVSTIFYIPTDAGAMYLKITSSIYVNNAATEMQLTNSMGNLPVFVAVSSDGYAAITREMEGQDGQSTHAEQYRSWLENWGKKQVGTVGENTYPVNDCSPQKMLTQMSDFEKQIHRILATTNRPLSEADCRLLDIRLKKTRSQLSLLCQSPVPNALCHADIRPGNIRIISNRDILYDWGMAFYGHPFYDALHFLRVVRRQLTETEKAEIRDAYLAQWQEYGNRETLLETYIHAEQCMEFFMLAADCRWVADILDSCGGIPPKGTIDHWLLGKRYYYFERGLSRFITESSS